MPVPRRPAALYLSHGGGPMPLLGDAEHAEMVEHLAAIAAGIDKPSAILVVSAHWEEEIATITSAARPGMIYDYYGFPPESYELQYPAPGAPELAAAILDSLTAAGVEARLDDGRGFDHGLYVPLMLMYPDADIPCLQLSLLHNLDPAAHIDIGQALSRLHRDGVLIIGSGFSFHNLRAFRTPVTPETRAMNEAFEAWLIDSCSDSSLDESERQQRLVAWTSAPGARFCHPREEHLLPLHVCYGVVGQACAAYRELHIMNRKASLYFW